MLLHHPKIDVNPANALYIAVEQGHAEVASLLLEKGADVNQATNNGDTPLMVAASYGKEEVLKPLLLWGAEPTKLCRIVLARTPLNLARETKHPNVANLLE